MAIIGAIITASLWWWRIKAVRSAVGDFVDLTGRIKENYKRRKFCQAAQSSPIMSIEDPVIAAATLICGVSMADMPAITEQEKAIIHKHLVQITDENEAKEAIIYGAWAARTVSDHGLIILRLGNFLRYRLNPLEKDQLLRLVAAVRKDVVLQLPIKVDNAPFESDMYRLRQRLGLEVDR